MIERICNICNTSLKQHKTKKKYFWCESCQKWFKCWLPMTDKQLKKHIDNMKEQGYSI
jgi:hypothetical protein